MINLENTSDNRAPEAEQALQEILAEQEKLGLCEFEVQRYSSSLRRLVISVTPVDANGSPQNDQRHFLLFEGVSFIQLIPFWKDAPLRWISREQRQDFLSRTGLANYQHYPPRLAHTKVGQMDLYIAFASVDFGLTMPEMTGEYKQ